MTEESKSITAMLYGDVARQLEPIIRSRFPYVNVVFGSRRAAGDACLHDVQCLIGWQFAPGVFGKMPKLEWIQSIAVGVEDWINDTTIPANTVVTNVKGIYSDAISEYVIWALLTLARRFHVNFANQAKRRWVPHSGDMLAGKAVGIAGMGGVGQAIAAKAKVFDMQTVAIVRDGSTTDLYENVDRVITQENATKVFGELDALILCLPLTPKTRNMIGKKEVSALKRGSILINVARADIVDHGAIVAALKSGHLAGAALDVFRREPLSRWSRLWRVKNLLVTPHISALSSQYRERVEDLVCENLNRFLSRQELRNIVDRQKGY